MDKQTAAAIRAWIKANRKSFGREQDPWARGYKKALDRFEEVVRLAASGDLDAIRKDPA